MLVNIFLYSFLTSDYYTNTLYVIQTFLAYISSTFFPYISFDLSNILRENDEND